MELQRGGVQDKSSLLVAAGAMVRAACGGADTPSGGAECAACDHGRAKSRVDTHVADLILGERFDRIREESRERARFRRSPRRTHRRRRRHESAPADLVASLQDPLCGIVLGDEPEDHDGASIQCLLDANEDRRRAVLVLVFTTEGDPLVEVWRSHAAGMSVAVDSTRDQFGSQAGALEPVGTWSRLPPAIRGHHRCDAPD